VLLLLTSQDIILQQLAIFTLNNLLFENNTNKYNNVLNDIVDDYNNTIHSKTKLTPENIDILMLSQIPGVSTVTAKSLLDVYGTMYELTKQFKETPTLLDIFTYGEKKRKLSKKIVESLKIYLHII
jgi:ERCC4-type nuclease